MKSNSLNKQYNILVYFCALLSGLVPRYISNFKIHIGIDFSLFSILVFITWIICVRRIRFYKKFESYFFFIWFLIIVGAFWRAHRIGIWFSYVYWILTAILFMQILYHKADEETFEIVIRGMVDALFIQLLIGIYEISAHRYLFEVGRVSRRLYGNVAISMFHNLNDYVTFVITIMPFAIYFLIKKKRLINRIYYLFIIVVSVFLVIRSESRSGYLSLILILGTVILLVCKKSKKNRIIVGVIIVCIALMIALIPAVRISLNTAIYNVLYDQSGQSDIVRINLIKNGLYFLKKTYGFGVGAGNLHYWLSERTIYPVNQVLYIHNWYIEILVTFGVLFFVLYAVMHIKNIVSLSKSVRFDRTFWTLNNTFLISFVAFTLVSIASSSNIYSEWVWMYLVLVPTFVLAKKTTGCRQSMIQSI